MSLEETLPRDPKKNKKKRRKEKHRLYVCVTDANSVSESRRLFAQTMLSRGFVRVRRWKFVEVRRQKRARKRKHTRNVRGEKLRNYQLHTSDIWCVRHEVWTAEKEQRLGDAAADGRFRYETKTTREPREREKWRADRDDAQTKAPSTRGGERTREGGCSLVSPAIILFN